MKLTSKLAMILLEGPKIFGTFQYPDAIATFEESLTISETKAVESFLNWIVAGGLSYGHGNLTQRWDEWAKATGNPPSLADAWEYVRGRKQYHGENHSGFFELCWTIIEREDPKAVRS